MNGIQSTARALHCMENKDLDLVILWDMDMYHNQPTTSGVDLSSENKGIALVIIWGKEIHQTWQVASGAGPLMENKGMALVIIADININQILSIATGVDPCTKDVALVMLHCRFQGVKITPVKGKNYSFERSN